MQDQVLQQWPEARPGMRYDAEPSRDEQMLNHDPAAKEKKTITVDTAAATHTFTLLNVDFSVAGSVGDKAATADAIRKAVTNNPLTGGYVDATDDDVDKVTLEMREAGKTMQLSSGDANLTLATVTSAADATAIEFGRLVVHDLADKTNFKLACLPSTSKLGAMQFTVTPSEVNDATYYMTVIWDGVPYTGTIVADASATVKEIVEAMVAELDPKLPASSVLLTEDDQKIIATSEIVGMPFEVLAWGDVAGADMVVARSDSHGAWADIDKVLAGAALEDQTVPGTTGTTILSYPGGSPMSVRKDGTLGVKVEDAAVEVGDDVWIGVGSGHEGKVRTTKSGANYAKTNRAYWRGRGGLYGSTNMGWLKIREAA